MTSQHENSLATLVALDSECRSLIYSEDYKTAQLKLTEALTSAMEMHGKQSLELIPYYYILIELTLQQRKMKQTEELLSVAHYILVKNDTTIKFDARDALAVNDHQTHRVKQLHYIRMEKLSSMLKMESKVYDEALDRAAECVYHSSLIFGPEHIFTSEGYHIIGTIFSRMHAEMETAESKLTKYQENALAMYDKVVDVWFRFLHNANGESLDQIRSHEIVRFKHAVHMLQDIQEIRTSYLGRGHVATGEASYTLALVHSLLKDFNVAKIQVEIAIAIYMDVLGESHPKTQDAVGFLQSLQDAIAGDG